MKIKSCYVENFGKLSKKQFDFTDFTSFCEANGFGKTTLAAFIKAMFYGMPSTRATSKDFNDRQHYCPFGGGRFGGNITVERGGREYKIVRFFGEKSATGDECSVTVDGEPLSPLPESIGKELFGIDESAFMRTVFVTSADTEISANASINAKLNNFVDNTDEANNFESAKKILETAAKYYKAGRGTNDLISRQKEKISGLKDAIRNLREIDASLKDKYEELQGLTARISAGETRLKAAVGRNAELQKWATYDGYVRDAEDERRALAELGAKYPAGIPDAEELARLSGLIEGRRAAQNRSEACAFPPDKTARLSELGELFVTPPEESRIDRALEQVTEITRLSAPVPPDTFKSVPDEEELDACSVKLAGLRQKRQEASAPVQPVRVKKSRLPFIVAGAGGALAAVGVALMFVQAIAGGVCLGLGAVALIAGFVLYFNKKINAVNAAVSDANIAVQADISRIENQIASFLAKYGYFTDEGVEIGFNNLTRDLAEFRAAQERYERSEKLSAEVKRFLAPYGGGNGDLQQEVIGLKNKLAEYNRLNAEYIAANTEITRLKEQIARFDDEIAQTLKKYGICADERLPETVKTLERDGAERERLIRSVARLNERAEAYRTQNGLSERPQGEAEDTAALSAELSSERDRRGVLNADIDDCEARTRELPEKEAELTAAEELSDEYKARYDVVKKALTCLERAEQNLKDRYVAPVKDRFLSYSSALESALGEKVNLDKNFRLTFERGGEDRSDRHLSAGQKSLSALCMRLALIDNMYPDESPFIIMDDPFVNLDGEHMARAAELVKSLSADRQIIYFCCHESRNVE